MDAEFLSALRYLGWVFAAGAGLFLLKVILSIALRGRVAPALLPDVLRPESTTQFLALLGHRAAPAQTLGTTRLRATLGLKLGYLAGLVVMMGLLVQMGSPVISLESGIFLLLCLATLQAFLLEISYDRDTITLPRWWFGRTTHKWKDLLALTSNDPWFMVFVFHKGPTIRINKYVVGFDQLVETARKHMREA